MEDREVVLSGPDGKARRVDPSGYIRYRLDLFETAAMTIRAGDLVRWTRNDAARGLVNGERAEVVSIGRRHVRMRREDGRPVALARDDPQLHHLDHAYSSTVHAAQGMTCDRVITVLDSDRGPLTDQAAFYVELTRARDNIVLLTDDRDALVDALETARGGEASALRAIGERFAAPAPAPAETPAPLREKPAMLAEAEREKRRAADRDIADALSGAAASMKGRERLVGKAGEDAGIALAAGYAEWRERAERARAACRTVLDGRETYDPRLARQPGAAERLGDLSQRLDGALAADREEVARREERERAEAARRAEAERQRREAAARAEAARRAGEERRRREAAERQRREERERAEAMRRAEEERQRRQAADRAIRGALSGLEAVVRSREEGQRAAARRKAHIVEFPQYPGWRKQAEAARAAARTILDDPDHKPRVARHPGAAERMARLSRRLDARLDADRAEIARREEERRQREAAERAEAERRAEEERRQRMQTRSRGRRM